MHVADLDDHQVVDDVVLVLILLVDPVALLVVADAPGRRTQPCSLGVLDLSAFALGGMSGNGFFPFNIGPIFSILPLAVLDLGR